MPSFRDATQAATKTARAATDASKQVARTTAKVAKTTAKASYGPTQWVIPFAVGALGGLVGYLLLVTRGHDSCHFSNDYLPDSTLYLLGVVAFFGGHFLGDLGAPAPTARSKRARRLGRISLVSAFLILGVIMVFEALGTAEAHVGTPTVQLEPITYYVRCAIYHDISSPSHGAFTVLVIALTFFLAGHWLWGARPTPESK